MDAARPGPATDPGKALFIDGDDDDVVRRQALPEPLAEIETDKANMAYEADVAGALTEIVVADGETAPVGAPIAVIGAAGSWLARAETQ